MLVHVRLWASLHTDSDVRSVGEERCQSFLYEDIPEYIQWPDLCESMRTHPFKSTIGVMAFLSLDTQIDPENTTPSRLLAGEGNASSVQRHTYTSHFEFLPFHLDSAFPFVRRTIRRKFCETSCLGGIICGSFRPEGRYRGALTWLFPADAVFDAELFSNMVTTCLDELKSHRGRDIVGAIAKSGTIWASQVWTKGQGHLLAAYLP